LPSWRPSFNLRWKDAAFHKGAAAELEAKLQSALEDAAFHEGAADELLAQQKALLGHLNAERAALSALSGGEVVAAVEAWLRRAAESGRFDPSRPLLGQGAELESPSSPRKPTPVLPRPSAMIARFTTQKRAGEIFN
jgi:hypothetical protein